MARATTEKFEEMVLEVETSTPGTYAKICGIMDVTITRTAQIDTTEIPDCDDESVPFAIEKEVRSLDVKISGSGVWAASSQDMLLAWWRSGATKNVRLKNLAAATGDIEIEAGAAFLASLSHSRTRGQKVTAEIELEINGLPSVTDAT